MGGSRRQQFRLPSTSPHSCPLLEVIFSRRIFIVWGRSYCSGLEILTFFESSFTNRLLNLVVMASNKLTNFLRSVTKFSNSNNVVPIYISKRNCKYFLVFQFLIIYLNYLKALLQPF